jgi:hypothetical protein
MPISPSRLHKRGHSVLPCIPCGGSAEPFLRSQEGSGKEELSRFARGVGLIAFNARSGTIPLRCGFEWAPRNQSCARRKARGRKGFRALREGWV